LKQLVLRYAIHTREYSDAVARLGEHGQVGPGFLQLVKEIRQRQALCISSGEALDRFIGQAVMRQPSTDIPIEVELDIDVDAGQVGRHVTHNVK
jgi:hypothetical protein